jgi:hypothetical protein
MFRQSCLPPPRYSYRDYLNLCSIRNFPNVNSYDEEFKGKVGIIDFYKEGLFVINRWFFGNHQKQS